jgi:SAM-dependent methyltransferase
MMPHPAVSFHSREDFPGFSSVAASEFFKPVLSEHGCQRILEIGSGANPTLPPDYVQSSGLSYVTSDLSAEELEKAHTAYEQLVLDAATDQLDPALAENFDCILSRSVGEHIRDGKQFHENIYRMLRPGGISIHCFSTLWSLPFAVNRGMPDWLSDLVLNIIAPRDRHRLGKFKAYYSWTRGPSEKMIRRFDSLGFEILHYGGYFGHSYYRAKLPWLDRMERRKSRMLLKHPVPQLCSYATLILRKPKGSI